MSRKIQVNKLTIVRFFLTYKMHIFFVMAAMVAGLFFFEGSVNAAEKENRKAVESYYKALEKDYVLSVKEILKDNGMENAGVMLTSVVNADKSREYALSIHHRHFASSKEESAKIVKAIEGLTLDIPDSSISIMTTY